MATSAAFEQLSPGVQSWLYRQGWTGLRPIQEAAIPLITAADRDLLITAPTAGGKTEAAFLPVVSTIEQSRDQSSFSVLCVSPLKALINDQFDRLESLCERAHARITPWHGDISQSVKQRAWVNPEGILLITPESLEALFVRRANELAAKFGDLAYVVVDEFHAFIGRERGQQLLSLLARIEEFLGRKLPRIALSATIGDARMALNALRPAGDFPGEHLASDGTGTDLQLVLKTFAPDPKSDEQFSHLAAHELFHRLRGKSHLVFANNRPRVEEVSDCLRRMSEQEHVPNEFFPHHGSLSKGERLAIEDRLRKGQKPATAIATSTLELGIDIGNVDSIAQIGAPSNVSSLRQRIGRSGRRGGPAKLRLFVERSGHLANATPIDRAELQLVQSTAVLTLMLEGYIEPPSAHRLHLSTLVQQVLSMIAFRGDVTATVAYRVLCKQGPWRHIDQPLFTRFLRSMGDADLIQQLNGGELIVGLAGERLVSHYEFYTSFRTPEEYRLLFNSRVIGTLPAIVPYSPGHLLIFAGRRWLVKAVDTQANTIELKPARQGKTPKFDGEAAPVDAKIRHTMRDVLMGSDQPAFCDPLSLDALTEARQYYRDTGLDSSPLITSAISTYWFVWDSDAVINTLTILLNDMGFRAGAVGPAILIEGATDPKFLLEKTAVALEQIESNDLQDLVQAKPLGKFDSLLSPDVLRLALSADTLDLDSTRTYFEKIQ